MYISHQGECRAERAVDDRCVLQGYQSPRPQTDVETVTFANEEQGDNGQNACTVVGAQEVESDSMSVQQPENRKCLCKK